MNEREIAIYRENWQTFQTILPGDKYGDYVGYPKAQVLIFEFEAELAKKACEHVVHRVDLTEDTSYNNGQVAKDSDGLMKV